MTQNTIDAAIHVPVTPRNFNDVRGAMQEAIVQNPADRRLKDKLDAFDAFYVQGMVTSAGWLTKLEGLENNPMINDPQMLDNVKLLAKYQVVRDLIEQAPDLDSKKKLEHFVVSVDRHGAQGTLGQKTIGEWMQVIAAGIPSDPEVKAAISQQFSDLYREVCGQNLGESKAFQAALETCLTDAHVHPKVAKQLVAAVVDFESTGVLSFELPTLVIRGGKGSFVREQLAPFDGKTPRF